MRLPKFLKLRKSFYIHLWLNWPMVDILLYPVAHVHSLRRTLDDDNWGGIVSEIILDGSLPAESLEGIETFSHVEILFYFDRVADAGDIPTVRHPRGNADWPKVGVFCAAQQGPSQSHWPDGCAHRHTRRPQSLRRRSRCHRWYSRA